MADEMMQVHAESVQFLFDLDQERSQVSDPSLEISFVEPPSQTSKWKGLNGKNSNQHERQADQGPSTMVSLNQVKCDEHGLPRLPLFTQRYDER